jgi:hypothetical protein
MGAKCKPILMSSKSLFIMINVNLKGTNERNFNDFFYTSNTCLLLMLKNSAMINWSVRKPSKRWMLMKKKLEIGLALISSTNVVGQPHVDLAFYSCH